MYPKIPFFVSSRAYRDPTVPITQYNGLCHVTLYHTYPLGVNHQAARTFSGDKKLGTPSAQHPPLARNLCRVEGCGKKPLADTPASSGAVAKEAIPRRGRFVSTAFNHVHFRMLSHASPARNPPETHTHSLSENHIIVTGTTLFIFATCDGAPGTLPLRLYMGSCLGPRQTKVAGHPKLCRNLL